jgi:DsbC/DsbD-like thiol-disulfide interchange protein/thioredoxin-related protein
MLWFKKLLGIVLVATGCFYLSLAFKPELTFTLIPLTLLIGGLYLGFLDPVGSKSAAFRIFRYIIGATLIFAAIYSWNIGQKPTFAWQPYSSTINRNQKPTAIYFSASWCIPCLELDRKTFTDQEVIENMQKLNRYKVDLTNYGSEESVKLRRKYSISGVPTLVFLDPDGIEVSHERVVGYIPPEVMNPKIERILTNSPPPEVTPNQPEQVASEPSEISLIADTATIEAGKSFKLGVLFQMQKDWYVYWKNPGDSGTPPQINWSLPEGFEIGEPEWPTPQRFDKPPFATYGFANLLLLAFPVSVPEKIENLTELEFKAEASWLVCREICIGQQGEAGLILPLAGQQTETRPEIDAETKAMFEQTASSIPLPEASWKINAKHDSRTVTLEIIKPEETSDSESLQIDFYPSQQGLFRHGGIKTRPVDQSFEIIMPRSGLPLPEKLHGILVIQNQGESQGKGFIKVIDLNL